MKPLSLSAAAARRAAVAAQGLAARRPGRVDARHLRGVLDRVGVVQIDSVNVLARAHELAWFSRVGPYRRDRLREVSEPAQGPRTIFEYWGHEASLLPVELQPALRWRMAKASEDAWGRLQRIARDRPTFVADVLATIAERGPVAASDLDDPSRTPGPWWNWGDVKVAVEYLFWSGRITARRRRSSFEREYDLPERVLPPEVLALPTPSDDDAKKTLLVRAAAALGVAAAPELADYYRLGLRDTRRLVDELAEDGALLPVAVEGWSGPAWLHPAAAVPRRVDASALVSPLDPLVWHRPRTERLWGMRLRFEVYTPAPKRVHGYFVLPFLLGDRLVARVDLKAERAAGVLRVKAAWAEPGIDEGPVAEALSAELALMATWLELDKVAVDDVGTLASSLLAAANDG